MDTTTVITMTLALVTLSKGIPLGQPSIGRADSSNPRALLPYPFNDIFFPPSDKGLQQWPGGIVPYQISSDFPANQRSIINTAVLKMGTMLAPHVTLLPYVRELHQNYITFVDSPGCWSSLGMVENGQVISLESSWCCREDIVMHEMMHALGYPHEQSRLDRDDHITMQWNNVQEDCKSQYGMTNIFYGCKYDYGSIMHYGSWACSNGAGPCFVPTDPSVDPATIGVAPTLTAEDICKIQWLYPLPLSI